MPRRANILAPLRERTRQMRKVARSASRAIRASSIIWRAEEFQLDGVRRRDDKEVEAVCSDFSPIRCDPERRFRDCCDEARQCHSPALDVDTERGDASDCVRRGRSLGDEAYPGEDGSRRRIEAVIRCPELCTLPLGKRGIDGVVHDSQTE